MKANNYDVIHDSDSMEFKTVINNTCGFNENSKQESIHTILSEVEVKE